MLIDFPRDVALSTSDATEAPPVNLRGYKPNLRGHAGQIKQLTNLLEVSRRPIIIAGGGVIGSGSCDELRILAESQQIPVVHTLMGLGALPCDHPLALGMAGVHGLVRANQAIRHADVLIGLGTRFSDRLTGSIEDFARGAKIVHIDIDPAEIGKNLRVDIPLVGDLKIVLNQLLEKLEPVRRPEWLEEIAALTSAEPTTSDSTDSLSAVSVMDALAKAIPPETIVTTDVGQHQLWAAQRLPFHRPRSFISSGGLGVMGYGIPAAVGAKLACPEATVITITGDGSFQIGLPELGTAKEQGLPLKILMLNNHTLGLVRQLQDFYSGQRHVAVDFSGNPDFGLLIQAYGGRHYPASDERDLAAAMTAFLADPGLCLLEAMVNPDEHVPSMVPVGC